MVTEEGTVGEDSGQQKSDVSLDHREDKDCIQTVMGDQVVKKIEMHLEK
jgi:hypothetical protein